ncbi:MAG TPA: hypothetical protein VJI75_06510 [Candidatus Nanoarchaeia archaeon]|nr:hypothetical protein [Candidatus Nanoarchaeia archaeon]
MSFDDAFDEIKTLNPIKRPKTKALTDLVGNFALSGLFAGIDKVLHGEVIRYGIDLSAGAGLYAGAMSNPLKGIYGLGFSLVADYFRIVAIENGKLPEMTSHQAIQYGFNELIAFGCTFIVGKVVTDVYMQWRYKPSSTMVERLIDKIKPLKR